MTQRGGLVSHWSHKPIKAVRIRPSATLRKILFIEEKLLCSLQPQLQRDAINAKIGVSCLYVIMADMIIPTSELNKIKSVQKTI
jgi:hypothetical protein